eukprot:scaffold6381_cov152-Isochrysis_galbana.AAC.1
MAKYSVWRGNRAAVPELNSEESSLYSKPSMSARTTSGSGDLCANSPNNHALKFIALTAVVCHPRP